MKIESYKDLIVWQKGMDLVIAVYELTKHFPREEMFALTQQMKRAAISIPSNIAEGSRRGSRKDFRHFLLNSYGSGAELETQIEIAKRLNFGKQDNIDKTRSIADEVMRMLNSMSFKLDS